MQLVDLIKDDDRIAKWKWKMNKQAQAFCNIRIQNTQIDHRKSTTAHRQLNRIMIIY